MSNTGYKKRLRVTLYECFEEDAALMQYLEEIEGNGGMKRRGEAIRSLLLAGYRAHTRARGCPALASLDGPQPSSFSD